MLGLLIKQINLAENYQASNTRNTIVLHRGYFSYNKGNSSTYPQGCIYRLKDREKAAVPNVFESFRIQNGNADYYEQLFISGFLNHQLNQAILAIKPYAEYDMEFLAQWLRKSKRRITETYLQGGQGNLSGTIVKELLIEFPQLQEQQQIGAFFRSLDDFITLHQRMKFRKRKKL